jgi:cytochrome oxidase Cu insertion factor (SCO1/SenC/PrrC family)
MKTSTLKICLIAIAVLAVISTVGFAEGEDKMIPVGETFADFDLEAHDGSRVSKSDLEGRPFLLFFYPKAATPG